MPSQTNPFVRGYQNVTVSRVLMITYEDDYSPCYRPIHQTQAHLSDDEMQLFPCIFRDDFALINEGKTIPDELEDQCLSDGIVRTVLYALMADDFGAPIHLGDAYSDAMARDVIDRLTFKTGHYSRCWEISSTHLPASAISYLEDRIDSDTSIELLFETFRVPASRAVGCKLLCTPWTDAHLTEVAGSMPQH